MIEKPVTKKEKLVYWGILFLTFILLSLINITVFRILNQNNQLISRNNGEQAINDAFHIYRSIDDIEEIKKLFLEQKFNVIGIGSYKKDGTSLFYWGTAPDVLEETTILANNSDRRIYNHSQNHKSVIILQHTPPRPPESEMQDNPNRETRKDFFKFFIKADFVYWEVSQLNYWRRKQLYNILMPVIELIMAAAIFYIGRLFRKNAEYRRRIEEQKNLVVLGNAASTLAHEIKNPLSTIRLQTELLKRLSPDQNLQELEIIDGEVQRLAMLTHHVNDYLRDPKGKTEIIDPVPIIADVSNNILGENRIRQTKNIPYKIKFDSERFRSVIENLLINAKESGSPSKNIEIEIGKVQDNFFCRILDRGEGVSQENLRKIYDPFFTTKSSGTGIGLPTVKRFIENANGTFSLKNRDGKGAIAVFEIPGVKL